MFKFSILTRVLTLFFASFKLLTDPKSATRALDYVTNSTLQITDSEASLLATLFISIAITDFIPSLDGNYKYFKSIGKVRFAAFAILSVVSYLQLVKPLSGDLTFYYFIFEVVSNGLVYAEHK